MGIHTESRDNQERRTGIHIVIVEDHPLMQKGLALTLQSEHGMEVVGMVATAEEAPELIAKTEPDLAIVDISLPGMSGLELIRLLKSRFEQLKILVISRHDEELFAERAIRAGARGYMMKMNAGDQVVEAVRKIMAGGTYLSEHISNRLLMSFSSGRTARQTSPIEVLSERELQVFRMIGNGRPTRDIAERLHISSKTVDSYKARIREKLGISDGSALLQRAVQWMKEES